MRPLEPETISTILFGNEEYLGCKTAQLFTTVAILVLLTFLHSFGHASYQALQERIFLARAHTTIRGQQLRSPLLELLGGDELVTLQVLKFSNGQIPAKFRPDSFNRIQISTIGWEPPSCKPMFVVGFVDLQEGLIVKPHPQPLEAVTLVQQKQNMIRSKKVAK